jgi:hypothetical protein
MNEKKQCKHCLKVASDAAAAIECLEYRLAKAEVACEAAAAAKQEWALGYPRQKTYDAMMELGKALNAWLEAKKMIEKLRWKDKP